jgi:hypothetical protein
MVLGGTGHGIADSFDKTRHDMAHFGGDIIHLILRIPALRQHWERCIGVVIGLAALVALWTVIVGAIIHHAGPAGSPAFIAILTAEIVVSLVTGVWEFRRNWAHPSRWTSRDDDRARTAGAWAGGLGSLIRTGNVLAGFVIGILALLSYGGILAAFVMSLAWELPSERAARQRSGALPISAPRQIVAPP